MTRPLDQPPVVLLATAAVTGLLHWGIGWVATPLAGVMTGLWTDRWHGLIGAAGVGGGWAGSVVYTAAVTPGAFRVLLDTLEGLAGPLPGEIFIALPVVLGSLLGGLGSGVGRCLRLLATAEG
jgi:hypothetical protein